MLKTSFKITLSLFYTLVISYNCSARTSFRSFGDHAQLINPVLAAGFSLHEKGLGHFSFVFIQPNAPTWLMHYKGSRWKWSLSKRPRKADVNGLKEQKNYTGMPSGHTVAAWTGPAYMRNFSENYKWFSIPLYISATLTAYSRIRAKAHTPLQVFVSIGLVEALAYINSKLNWSKNYCATDISIGGDGFARISFKF